MSCLFQREPLTAALWDEAYPLLLKHWREVSHFQDIPLEPDVARYHANEQNGVLRCFTARSGDEFSSSVKLGALVGYALYIVAPNAHYKSSVQAVQDVIYIDPAFRGGTGYRFIAWCDAQLAAEGVQAVYQHIKAAHNFGAVLERQGYELVDLIYAKRLDAAPMAGPSAQEALDEAFV